jgi:aminomethyltransferase
VEVMAKVTQLYSYHKENAKIVEFAGFVMPLWYKGIQDEHMAVRERVGIFDVSHMGRYKIEGKEAMKFMNYLLPSNMERLKVSRCSYATILNERGGIIDDEVTSKLSETNFLMVANAATREKDWEWVQKQAKNFDVEVKNISDESAMFALQGPFAHKTLQKLVDINLAEVKRFANRITKIKGNDVLISRTGYTGEDGFEIIVFDATSDEPKKAEDVWFALLEAGKEFGIMPCGLGARDTLRLEAGMCLYGNDIDEDTTPLEANLSWFIDFNKDFIGKDALVKQKEEGIKKIRVGIMMKSKAIPRAGYKVIKDGKEIGKVTSGTFSPLLKIGIAMGYVAVEFSEEGTEVSIEIRGKEELAFIKSMPFYDTTKYGFRRKIEK